MATEDSVAPSARFRRWRRSRISASTGFVPRPSQLAIAAQRLPTTVTFKKNQNFYTSITNPLNGPVGAVVRAVFTEIPDYDKMATLFNRYRISECKLRFRLIDSISNNADNLSSQRMPLLSIRKNQDPNLAPASINGTLISQFDNVATFQFTPEQTMVEYVVKPSVGRQVTISGTTNAISQGPAPWLDCTYNSVPHHLVWLYLDYIHSSCQVVVDFEWTVDLKYDV